VVTLATGALDASIPAKAKSQRLAHFDWMRGLACVLMFQTHCYDAWLAPAARSGKFFMFSQLVGSLPAPLFLFLAGISAFLMAKKLSGEGGPALGAGRVMGRGFEVWGLGLLFRVQEYLIAFPWAPWTDLLRVDVLNCIGVSLVLVGLLFRISSDWRRMVLYAGLVSAGISMLSPVVWTHRFSHLPWFLESYLNGVHNQAKPLPWLFPIFPWTAFAFAGVAIGSIVLSDAAKRFQRSRIGLVAAAGLLVWAAGQAFSRASISIYPERMYDFWHTSPSFFLMRLGVLLGIVAVADLRCRLQPLVTTKKALVLMGQHSLLVYWVHIEFVYGRLHILPRQGVSIVGATAGLLVISLAMLLLAYLRANWKPTLRGVQRSRASTA
jgi:uncharacterized membrane protein